MGFITPARCFKLPTNQLMQVDVQFCMQTSVLSIIIGYNTISESSAVFNQTIPNQYSEHITNFAGLTRLPPENSSAKWGLED